MPFRRRFRGRRKRRRRSRRFRGRRSFRRRRMVALDPERKNIGGIFTRNVSFNGTVDLLNGVPQGVTANERLGRQHLNLSMLLKYRVTMNPVLSIPTLVRVALVWDKQANMQLMVAQDLWDQTQTIYAPLGGRLLLNGLRFKVLWSRTHRVDLGDQMRWHQRFTRFRLKTRYVGAQGAITNITSGALYLVMISDADNTVADSIPILDVFHRLRFVG